jgi:copper oxidase (laccase) domain-containing protein
MEITHLTVPQWQTHSGLLHGFMGRRGGKSIGVYAGLKRLLTGRVMTKGRQPKRLRREAGGGHTRRQGRDMRQVHGDTIVESKTNS